MKPGPHFPLLLQAVLKPDHRRRRSDLSPSLSLLGLLIIDCNDCGIVSFDTNLLYEYSLMSRLDFLFRIGDLILALFHYRE